MEIKLTMKEIIKNLLAEGKTSKEIKNHPNLSHYSKNSICWYLTKFKTGFFN